MISAFQYNARVRFGSVTRESLSFEFNLNARSIACWTFAAVMLLATLGCGKSSTSARPQPGDPVQGLQQAIESRDWHRAERLSKQAMIASPDDADVLTNVAIATANLGRRVEAAHFLVDAARVSGYGTQDGRVDHAIRGLLEVGRVYEAIEFLENVLRENPEAATYRRMLIGFLGEVQLTQDLDAHMHPLIRDRMFDVDLLIATTDNSARRFSSKSIEMLLERNPDDYRPRLGTAFRHLGERDAGSAEQVLREILRHHPDFAPAHAMLGRALVVQGKLEAIPEWFDRLPEATSNYAGYWITLAAQAEASGNTPGVIRALGEAARRAPNDTAVWTKLSAALRTLQLQQDRNSASPDDFADVDFDAIATSIDHRTKDLLDLRKHFSLFAIENDRNQRVAVMIARKLLDLGRNWEAEAWLAVATTLRNEPADDLNELHREAVQRLQADRSWQSSRDHPELSFDLTRFPRPGSPGVASLANRAATYGVPLADRSPSNEIRFLEEASRWDLRFYGAVGDKVRGPKVPIHQTLGCGGGVIDLDHDGKHDLVFTAAGGSLRGRDNEPGAIFRNLGASFRDVSGPSGFADHGFGHGVVVSDYNDDGFQDILVLNLGHNRLFRNNGDGSFSDATIVLEPPDEGDWSTSGAILDVNGDGFNDVVVVNYCDADQPLDEPCFDSDGQEINCYPLRFRAGRDQFLQGRENGAFVDVTSGWVGQPAAGRGLGIIAGRLDGRVQGIYIANDGSSNSYYRWRDEANAPMLVDAGIASGLAVDAQSMDQGSMGIASGDFDNDGDLDLYVSGFSQEYNIYYEQKAPGLWSDQTAMQRMVTNTLKTVGFGTQAIDFDNDGLEELVVTNGHIGDFGPELPPYAQPIQCFRRSASGEFELLDVGAWDEYFAAPHVGRALFTCDVNSDGRTDLVVTHATEPVALLVNHSQSEHHQIAFRLVDTRMTRDAVGAIVQFELGTAPETSQRQLFRLAGDGYLCSNRPELSAGIGPSKFVRNVQVTWPDGEVQKLGDLEADTEYIIVRNEKDAFPGKRDSVQE